MAAKVASAARRPDRRDGYAPIADYAAIGNKRTAALVALDGAIDWLPLPDFEGPTVFAALLDPARGGRMTLSPSAPFEAERAYVQDTNVLATTFHTATGTVRVTDALSRPAAHPLLWNQVVRRVEGVAGEVEMAWAVAPRFDYGAVAVRPRRSSGVPVFIHGEHVLAVEAFDVGEPALGPDAVTGHFVAREGETGVLALSAFHQEPLTFSMRDHVLHVLDATIERWRIRVGDLTYHGAWKDAVVRSALALDLLVDDRTGAIAAAATMALPERIGGERNYDYRYTWLRDSNLTLEAMLRLGLRDQVHTSLGWMLRTMARTQPRLRPMYRLDGSVRLASRELPLAGYRGSRPVTVGNPAQDQLQLGNYGDVLDMTLNYVQAGGALNARQSRQLAETVDFLCWVWRRPDASIWELSDRRQYTQSKLACWLAFDRAARLAELGQLPAARASRWEREADAVRRYVAGSCWSPARNAYVRDASGQELDAAVLLATRGSFLQGDLPRLEGTIDAIARELGAGGPLIYRFSGTQEIEGAFLACSFWLAEALSRAGRVEEAVERMDALVALANDVGLYAEEVDPSSGDFLGNFPQALTHLALVNAASQIDSAARRDDHRRRRVTASRIDSPGEGR